MSSAAATEFECKSNSSSKSESASVVHLPSLHMHLGKDISTIGKKQNRRLQTVDMLMNFEYSEPVTEDDLFSLFSVDNHPTEPAKRLRSIE